MGKAGTGFEGRMRWALGVEGEGRKVVARRGGGEMLPPSIDLQQHVEGEQRDDVVLVLVSLR